MAMRSASPGRRGEEEEERGKMEENGKETGKVNEKDDEKEMNGGEGWRRRKGTFLEDLLDLLGVGEQTDGLGKRGSSAETLLGLAGEANLVAGANGDLRESEVGGEEKKRSADLLVHVEAGR